MRPDFSGSLTSHAGGRQQLARLVDDALVAGEDTGIVDDDFAREHRRRHKLLLGQHLEIGLDLDVVAGEELRVDRAQHVGGMRVDGDDRLHAVFLEHLVYLAGMLRHDLVGAQVVSQRARIQIVLVQVAELDPACLQQLRRH